MQLNHNSNAPVPQEFCLNFEKMELFECGAELLTFLAYPDAVTDDSAAAELFSSLCHSYLRYQFLNAPAEQVPQLMKPLYAFRDARQFDKDLRLLEKRLPQRMAAANTVIPFLQEVELGRLPPLPGSIKRLSLNQVAGYMSITLGQSDPENFESRIWRPSLPVVHIAAAIQITHADFLKASGVGFSYMSLMEDRALLEFIVQRSEEYAELLLRSDYLKVAPETLIRFRIAK